MIARHAKVQALRTTERAGEPNHYSALVTADGIDSWMLLTAEEYAWAKSTLASGARLVLTISEEASS